MPRRTLVKICGVRTFSDALAAAAAGADAVGVNFVPGSPRCVEPAFARAVRAALPANVQVVAVTADAADLSMCAGLNVVQLHGAEPPAAAVAAAADFVVWKAFCWRGAGTAAEIDAYWAACGDAAPAALLLDTHRAGLRGGTGEAWAWQAAAVCEWPAPLILAGGLNPENVADAIRALRPWMVDVASGVESAPGVKSADRMRAFVAAVRAAHDP